jgi:hypothetical protein
MAALDERYYWITIPEYDRIRAALAEASDETAQPDEGCKEQERNAAIRRVEIHTGILHRCAGPRRRQRRRRR